MTGEDFTFRPLSFQQLGELPSGTAGILPAPLRSVGVRPERMLTRHGYENGRGQRPAPTADCEWRQCCWERRAPARPIFDCLPTTNGTRNHEWQCAGLGRSFIRAGPWLAYRRSCYPRMTCRASNGSIHSCIRVRFVVGLDIGGGEENLPSTVFQFGWADRLILSPTRPPATVA
jgi:hypothetical protein